MLHWRHWNFYSKKSGDWAWVFGLARYIRMETLSDGRRWFHRRWVREAHDRCIAALQNLAISDLLAANPYLVVD